MISAKISSEKRKKVYRRDGWGCALCGSNKYLQIHHVIPRGEGGPNTEQNLITLCADCHALAHGTDLRGLVDAPTQEEVAQLCVEYVSDYYASMTGQPWDPWKKDTPP